MVPDYEKYLPNIHRFVAVPLKISDHIIGHLQIVNPQPSQDTYGESACSLPHARGAAWLSAVLSA